MWSPSVLILTGVFLNPARPYLSFFFMTARFSVPFTLSDFPPLPFLQSLSNFGFSAFLRRTVCSYGVTTHLIRTDSLELAQRPLR